jgi:hypothetical protein
MGSTNHDSIPFIAASITTQHRHTPRLIENNIFTVSDIIDKLDSVLFEDVYIIKPQQLSKKI